MKAVDSPSRKLAPQPAARVARSTGGGAIEQTPSLQQTIGNDATRLQFELALANRYPSARTLDPQVRAARHFAGTGIPTGPQAASHAAAVIPTSDRVIALLSYSAFDWAVSEEEQRQILDLLRTDADLSATIVALNHAGMLRALLERVREENRRELLRLLGARSSPTARALVEPIIQDLDIDQGALFGAQIQYNLGRLGVSDGAAPFDRRAYSDLISGDAMAPLTGSGATGINPSERGYSDWAGAGRNMLNEHMGPLSHEYFATFDEYIGKVTPDPRLGLFHLFERLTLDQRQRVAELLSRESIGVFTVAQLRPLAGVLASSQGASVVPELRTFRMSHSRTVDQLRPLAELLARKLTPSLESQPDMDVLALIRSFTPDERLGLAELLSREPIGSLTPDQLRHLVELLTSNKPGDDEIEDRLLHAVWDLTELHTFDELRPLAELVMSQLAGSLTADERGRATALFTRPPSGALTPEQRLRQIKLLVLQPISTVYEASYAGKLPSRLQIMRAAAAANNLDPKLVVAFILAEQRDQSRAEDARDWISAFTFGKDTSIGLGQILPSTARKNDLFENILTNKPSTFGGKTARGNLNHSQLAWLLASDETNIFAVARYIRILADAGSKVNIAALPDTRRFFPGIDLAAYARNSSEWPEDNIGALGMYYTSVAWTDNVRSFAWGRFVQQAYRDVKATGLF